MALVGERHYCAQCGEATFHRYDFDEDEPEDVKRFHCSVCDRFLEVPKVDGFCVTITNITDPTTDPLPGQFTLVQHFKLTTKEAALEQALVQAAQWAKGINSRGGLTTKGIMIDVDSLRSQATVAAVRI